MLQFLLLLLLLLPAAVVAVVGARPVQRPWQKRVAGPGLGLDIVKRLLLLLLMVWLVSPSYICLAGIVIVVAVARLYCHR